MSVSMWASKIRAFAIVVIIMIRTVEVHRTHLMRKLGVNNLIGLVQRAVVMGLVAVSAK